MNAIRFGIDLAKNVIQVHGVDENEKVVVRRQLRRSQVLDFFGKQPSALIGMEACGSAHHWARELSRLGHKVRLMPASYVKAYVKRNKNDARDAEACCEAVSRPTMRFVPTKSVEQQSARAIQKTRDLLVRQRTQGANAVRGHLYEMGIISSKGSGGMAKLAERIEAGDSAIPAPLLDPLRALVRQWRACNDEISKLDDKIREQIAQDEAAKRLMTIPGVGPQTAHAVLAAIDDGSQFSAGRDFAAWVGLTRLNRDTGGKHKRVGKISRAGDGGLRRLLVLGSSSVVTKVRKKPGHGSAWINALLARRPVKVCVVAQAAKTARIIWAVLVSGEEYRAPTPA